MTVGSTIRLTQTLHYPTLPNVPAGTCGEIIPAVPRWNVVAGQMAISLQVDAKTQQIAIVSPDVFEVVEHRRAKALTLWQPYASLIAIGAKKVETRSWATTYRGPLIIHASQKWNAELEFITTTLSQFPSARRLRGKKLVLGAALCMVDLVDVVPLETLNVRSDERAFGDWSPGRFGWLLENVRPFIEPIPCKGAQGLWNWKEYETPTGTSTD